MINKLIFLVGLLNATTANFLQDKNTTLSTSGHVSNPKHKIVLDLDSDGDGIFNLSDLDDDNDGILDTAEGFICTSQLNRNIIIGYVNQGVGAEGLMINMLNNPVNFSFTGTYNKIPGVTFIGYTTQAAVTENQLLIDKIDVFYSGSNALNSQNPPNKLLTTTNQNVLTWQVNNPNKVIVVMQNNAVDFGYLLTDNNVNPNTPFGPQGSAIYTNGYWPVNTFNQTGTVQMTASSTTRPFEKLLVDATGKPTLIRDLDRNMILFPDKTTFDSNSANPDMTNATLKVAGNSWAYAFDQFLAQNCISTDTDGDNIPNHLDTDSDNDGCPDAVEGGGNITRNQLDVNGRITGGVNSNGIPIAVGSGQTQGTSTNSGVQDPACKPVATRVVVNTTCPGSTNGSIDVSVTGGLTPYIYQWSGNSTATTQDLNNIGIGTYNITITDALGQTFSLNNIAVTSNNPTPTTPTISSVIQPTCAVSTGTIIFNTQTGVQYSINNGGTYQASNIFSNVAQGNYNLRVRSTIGSCVSNVTNVTITAASGPPATPTATITQPTCAVPTGTIVFNAQTGVEYSINNGGTYQASNNFSNVATGSYTLRVRRPTDNTCSTAGATVTINAIPATPVIVGNNLVNVGQTTQLSGSGSAAATNPWVSSNTLVATVNNTGLVSGLAVGSASITYTNNVGCMATTNVTVSSVLTYCYKLPVTNAGITVPTKLGITSLRVAGSNDENWPMVRQGAWTVLESKEKGFVVNRVATTADLNTIANPIQGMMVYDREANCLKIYTIKEGNTLPAWYCFNTQACPD